MKTRSLYCLAAAGGLLLLALAAPQPISGQDAAPAASPAPQSSTAVAPKAAPDEIPPRLAALIDEINAQTRELTANQAKIDAKVDQLAETIRQARLFAARSGSKGGSK